MRWKLVRHSVGKNGTERNDVLAEYDGDVNEYDTIYAADGYVEYYVDTVDVYKHIAYVTDVERWTDDECEKGADES